METTEITSEPRRLVRPKQDRWLGGVAAGLGAYFDLSPALYRIAFVVLALAGGTGIVLYLVAWLVVPEEGAADSLAAEELRRHRGHPRRLVGLAVLAFAAILALSEAHVWPSPGNLWLALALALAAVAWWRLGPSSRARRRVALGSLLALVAAGAVALVLFVSVPLFAGIGKRLDAPTVATDVHSRYTLGMGKLELDFSGVELPKGQTFVKATVGIGDLVVTVPADATVDVEGRVQAGNLVLLGQQDGGARIHSHVVDRTGSGRVLVLDLHTGIGDVKVLRG
ncbi:MAG TPA: PspC domain-containing protein [Gaiellaceae bacterium]|nr:PspC domain-containing protein [Gaiellaceae bacterium]